MAPSKIVQERKAFNTEVGRRVAGLRKLRGLTQLQLAEAASAPQSTISSIESGGRGATPQQRGRIAEALGVPLAALDPMQVPAERFAEVAGAGPALEPAGSAALSDLGSTLPRGLEGFLERQAEAQKITRRERWYLTQSRFRAEPWVELDDDFWGEMLGFWRGYLHKQDGGGGGASRRHP